MTKKRIGEQVAEHNAKNLQFEDDLHEYTLSMGKDQRKRLEDFAAETSQKTRFKQKNFYISLVITVDPLLQEPKFIVLPARLSCPTPCYQHTVYKYHWVSGDLEYLWHIPSKAKAMHIQKNLKTYYDNPATRTIAAFVESAHSGRLLQWAIKENGEKKDALVFRKPQEN